MDADNSFYVKFIATEAPPFFGHNISLLASGLLSHLVIAPLVCSRTQAHLSIPKWGASWGKKWLIFSRDLDSDPVFVPRIDDTESVEKSLLHTEANCYGFLTAGAHSRS